MSRNSAARRKAANTSALDPNRPPDSPRRKKLGAEFREMADEIDDVADSIDLASLELSDHDLYGDLFDMECRLRDLKGKMRSFGTRVADLEARVGKFKK